MNFRESLAWAAGFFDGEGHVGLRTRRGRSYEQLQLAITQADRQVLDRFAAAVGPSLGKVYGPYDVSRYNVRSQPVWRYVSVHHTNVQAIVAMLWEWLSPVKREQARAALTNGLREMRTSAKYRDACKYGHPYTPRNTFYYYQSGPNGNKSRACRTCRNGDMARAREKRKLVRLTVAALLEA